MLTYSLALLFFIHVPIKDENYFIVFKYFKNYDEQVNENIMPRIGENKCISPKCI